MSKKTNSNGPKDGGSYLARALEKWDGKLPDWIEVLARATDEEAAGGGSQATLAKKLGGNLSASVISGILGKTYPGKLDRHEATVRGKLMSATVKCPALGMTIGRDACARNQARKFSAANPQAVQLARTCPTCANAIGGKP